jgi:hypothetical protein
METRVNPCTTHHPLRGETLLDAHCAKRNAASGGPYRPHDILDGDAPDRLPERHRTEAKRPFEGPPTQKRVCPRQCEHRGREQPSVPPVEAPLGGQPSCDPHQARRAKRLTIAPFDSLYHRMSRGRVQTERWRQDREFTLLVAACRSLFDPAARSGTAELARERLDWGRFERLASFHRVQGLADGGLRKAGVGPPDELHRHAQFVVARNLENIAACSELLDRFGCAGLSILFLKGLPLGVLAYGTPWLKAAVDIDLLIEDDRLEDAVSVLRSLEFRREHGGPEGIGALRTWHRFRKDSEWVKPDSSVRIDLHTRLTDNPWLLPAVGIDSARQDVDLARGIRLPSLADDELFAHLCVHGASSAWFRLKWITDLAALLRPKQEKEIVRLYRRSQELGAGRAAGQALLLAHDLYESLENCPGLLKELARDGRSRWLYRQALRQLAGGAEPVEPTAGHLGTLRIHMTQFLLQPGLKFKASELVRQARAALG